MDYTGCGNTVNCNHPLVDKLIVECLEFWVREMHVDGFRFDEGSILSRGEDGAPMVHPPVIWHIELSEDLADTKVFAEAWDAAGLYQIGYFPGYRWAEWNGRYRDDVRRFVKGDAGLVSEVASRIAGSADIYQSSGHLPINSVNCHDGFTLNDLVSYDEKHNEANGEGNRDGVDDDLSWNCGWEGPSDDPGIEAFRERQIRNFATILMLSQGVPIFVAGDEVRRTQQVRQICDFYLDAQFPDGHIDFSQYRTQITVEGTKVGNAMRQETDTISRMVYGFATAYLLTGEDKYLEGAEKGTEYLREHLRFIDHKDEIVYWYHAGHDHEVLPGLRQRAVRPGEVLRGLDP